MDKKKYFRIYGNVFKVEGKKGEYTVLIYDMKSAVWKSADIKGKTLKECKDITTYVYDGLTDDEKNLEITIDYGNETNVPTY